MTGWDFAKYVVNLAYDQWMVTALFLFLIVQVFYGDRKE